MTHKNTLQLVSQVLDRLASGEEFNQVVEQTGVTARVSEALNEPPASLGTRLISEIPEGSEITVQLKNGDKFTGFEASGPRLFEMGILRLEVTNRDATETNAFFTTHDEVASVRITYGS